MFNFSTCVDIKAKKVIIIGRKQLFSLLLTSHETRAPQSGANARHLYMSTRGGGGALL